MVHRSWCLSSRAVTAVVGAAIWLAVATTSTRRSGRWSRRARFRRLTRSSKALPTARSATSRAGVSVREMPDLPQAHRRPNRRAKKGVHRDVTGSCENATRNIAVPRCELRRSTSRPSTTRPKPGSRWTAATPRWRATCARCHKTRSFLKLAPRARVPPGPAQGRARRRPARMPHDGHPFADARKQFDHAKAKFAAHRCPPSGRLREVPRQQGSFRRAQVRRVRDCHRSRTGRSFGRTAPRATPPRRGGRELQPRADRVPLTGAHAAASCVFGLSRQAGDPGPPGVRRRRAATATRRPRGAVQAGLRDCHAPMTFKKAPFNTRWADAVSAHRAARRARLCSLPQGRGNRRTVADDRKRGDDDREVLGSVGLLRLVSRRHPSRRCRAGL